MQVIDVTDKTKLLTVNYDISVILIEVINGNFINLSNNDYLNYKRLVKPIYCNLVSNFGSPYLSEVFTLQYEKNFIDCNKYGNSIRGIQVSPNTTEIRISFEPKTTKTTQPSTQEIIEIVKARSTIAINAAITDINTIVSNTNNNRLGFLIRNTGVQNCYLKLGNIASLTNYDYVLPNNAVKELALPYTGVISAICDSGKSTTLSGIEFIDGVI